MHIYNLIFTSYWARHREFTLVSLIYPVNQPLIKKMYCQY